MIVVQVVSSFDSSATIKISVVVFLRNMDSGKYSFLKRQLGWGLVLPPVLVCIKIVAMPQCEFAAMSALCIDFCPSVEKYCVVWWFGWGSLVLQQQASLLS